MRLSFAWWNTALSPVGKPRKPTKKPRLRLAKDDTLDLINLLLTKFDIDFIAMGEVSEEDIRFFRQGLVDGFAIQSSNINFSDPQFYTCFVWREQKLLVVDSIKRVSGSLRIAQRVDLRVKDTNDLIHIVISHWPSGLWREDEQLSSERHQLGMRLREVVDEIFSWQKEIPYTILMGDYNHEPFDHSISFHLKATRDREFACKKQNKRLLYNPFWRHMVRPLSNKKNPEYRIAGGSYYYKGGAITRWRTFDQMIFSTEFLSDTGWCLNETMTGIVNIPEYYNLVVKTTEYFDHMPIMGVIEREVDNG